MKYYTNVIAYSYAGLHMTVSSDGFMMDGNHPVSGLVYDGVGKKLPFLISFILTVKYCI